MCKFIRITSGVTWIHIYIYIYIYMRKWVQVTLGVTSQELHIFKIIDFS